MTFRRFSLLLGTRVALVTTCLTVFAWLVIQPGYYAATALFAALAIGLVVEMFRFVERTNRELSRFLESARYADFSQRFEFSGVGAGFEELGTTLVDILDGFRLLRSEQERELRHLKALVEHVPVPLLSVHANGALTLWNNRARRLFGAAQVARLDDIAHHGNDFIEKITSVMPGERQLTRFRTGEMERQLTIAVSQLVIGGQPERLISLQDIQSELDGMQLQAWQDLVRVLTHEIMNSITPVASLAKTAETLLEETASGLADRPELDAELRDVRDAVATVARRSDSLMAFVASYRRLTQIPAPSKTTFPISELFQTTAQLAENQLQAASVRLLPQVEPAQLTLNADRGMIEQLLINLVQNAIQALADRADGEVRLQASLNERGHVCLVVADNGPGISDELQKQIFVPFFTTRRDGSGVGLAISRQIMIAHGGYIAAANDQAGGARFTLVF